MKAFNIAAYISGVALVMVAFSSCSTNVKYSEHQIGVIDPTQGGQTVSLSYPAERRGLTILYKYDDASGNPRPIVLAEPPPDGTKEFNSSLELSIKSLEVMKPELTEKFIKLADLNENNYMLRDALYRLNEALIIQPDLITTESYVKIYEMILKSYEQNLALQKDGG